MKSGYSIGFRQSLVILLDSTRVWLFQWILPESSGLARRKKSRQIPRTLLEYAGFGWTPPDSSRNKYADLALVTPRHSGIPGVSGREGGGVYSPHSSPQKKMSTQQNRDPEHPQPYKCCLTLIPLPVSAFLEFRRWF